MPKVLKLCSVCYSNLTEEDFINNRFAKYDGDFRYVESDCNECPKCGSSLMPCNLTEPERLVIAKVSEYNREVFDAMRKLKTEDPIEFTLKIGQFKQLCQSNHKNEMSSQISKPSETKQIQHRSQSQSPTYQPQVNDYKPKCPTCGSKAIRKIGTVERAGSVYAFGLMTKKIGKSFECTNCGYMW